MQELSDFLYLMDTINDNHINVLKNANLSDSTRYILYLLKFLKNYKRLLLHLEIR